MRGEIEGRPIIAFGIGLVAGLIAQQGWWALLFALGAIVWIRPLPCRFGVVLGFLLGLWIAPDSPNWVAADQLEKRSMHAIGTVVSTPNMYESTSSSNVSCGVGVFRVTSEDALVYGDTIEFTGMVRPVREGMENYSSFRGVSGTVFVAKNQMKVLSTGPVPFQWGHAWKRSFVDFSDSTLGPDQGRIVRALTFNIDEGLEPEFRANLQRTGTIHIISASGAHVLIFAVSLVFLLSLAPIPRGIQVAALIAVLCIYALAAGFRPPIVRAVIMAALAYSAYLFRREPDLLTALAISLVTYLLWQPASVYDIGFQLSFANVGALALFCRFDHAEGLTFFDRLKHTAGTFLRASFVAWIGSAPLVAYHFGALSLISVPANFAIALLIAPVMMLSLLAHGVSFVLFPLSVGIMKAVVAPLSAALEAIVNGMGQLSFASIQVPEFSPWWIVAYYGIAIALWRQIARKA